jgi:hypothetical protein
MGLKTLPESAASARNKRTILYFAVIAAGAIFYLYYGVYKIFCTGSALYGQDFTRGLLAAGNYLGGRSIYLMPPSVNPYYYSPPVTLIFMPFMKLSVPAAKMLWLLVCHILAATAFFAIYGYGSKAGKALSAAAAAAVLLFSTPLYQTLFTGNLNMLIFSGLALAYAALLSGRDRLVPPALAVFSVIKVFPIILMGVFIRRRDYAACRYFMFAAATVATVSLAVFGVENNLAYIRQLPSMTRFAGPLHSMSFSFFVKLFWPGVGTPVLISVNAAFLSVLWALWLKASGTGSAVEHTPGMVVTDLFALTAIMILVLPSSWVMYCVLYSMPLYFVFFSFLEGRKDFRFPWVIIAVFLFMDFWEILYYHLPLSVGGLTARMLEIEKGRHSVLFPLIFSGHFMANLCLFFWVLFNYRELAVNVERIGN